jgi:hypothetical protein
MVRHLTYRWKILNELSDFLVKRLDVLEFGRLMQLLEVMYDFAHDLRETFA